MLHSKPDGRELVQLTDKHREVLDLLLQHKKRKAVARDLELSLITIDKRIAAAKKVLGTTSLEDTLHTYQALCGVYSKAIYSENQLPPDAQAHHSEPRNGDVAVFTLADVGVSARAAPWQDGHVLVPRMLEGPAGSLKRIVYIVAAASGILMVVLVGLSVAKLLGEML